MLTWMFDVARARQPRRDGRSTESARLVLENLEDRTLLATSFLQTNLVSDVANVAQVTDPHLHNPWGLAVNPAGDFWVANAGSGTITLYKGDVNGSAFTRDTPVITTPIDPLQTQVTPTGQVYNPTKDFVVNGGPAPFIFAGQDGTLSVTTPANRARVVAVVQGAVYTGLAIGANGSGNYLFVANVAGGRIDVFDRSFQQVLVAGSFIDPHLPANLRPFNVTNIKGTLFVTYENPNNDSVGGVVDTFDTNGHFLGRFADGSNLSAPWGVALAPASFGSYGNDLLVGNFGDGHISAYDPATGNFLGQLIGSNGQPVAIERLWQLTFGNGTTAGDAGTLYFTSGLNAEQDGLVGSLKPLVPTPGSFVNQVYLDLLQRPADPGGLAYWNGLLSIGVARRQIVSDIENSGEFLSLEVNSLYVKLLHRAADPNGLNYWAGKLGHGTTLEEIASGMAGSAEYVQTHGGTNDTFIAAIYQDALGRAPDTGGQAFFTAEMQGGTSAAQVAEQVFGSDEFKRDRIASFYQTFLHRAPEATGLAFFLAALKKDARDEQVIGTIVASDEYFARLTGQSGNGQPQGGGSGSGGGSGYGGGGGVWW